MKKALQVGHFRAAISVSDGAAVRGPGEAHSRSFFYRFAEFFRRDRRRELACLPCLLERGLRRRRPPSLLVGLWKLRERPSGEAKGRRRARSEGLTEAGADRGFELL